MPHKIHNKYYNRFGQGIILYLISLKLYQGVPVLFGHPVWNLVAGYVYLTQPPSSPFISDLHSHQMDWWCEVDIVKWLLVYHATTIAIRTLLYKRKRVGWNEPNALTMANTITRLNLKGSSVINGFVYLFRHLESRLWYLIRLFIVWLI